MSQTLGGSELLPSSSIGRVESQVISSEGRNKEAKATAIPRWTGFISRVQAGTIWTTATT